MATESIALDETRIKLLESKRDEWLEIAEIGFLLELAPRRAVKNCEAYYTAIQTGRVFEREKILMDPARVIVYQGYDCDEETREDIESIVQDGVPKFETIYRIESYRAKKREQQALQRVKEKEESLERQLAEQQEREQKQGEIRRLQAELDKK